MSEMESYQAQVGPADEEGGRIYTLQAEDAEHALYLIGVAAALDLGAQAAEWVVKSLVSQTQFMEDRGAQRARTEALEARGLITYAYDEGFGGQDITYDRTYGLDDVEAERQAELAHEAEEEYRQMQHDEMINDALARDGRWG